MYDLTSQLRTFTTEANGSFMFTNLVPGEYSVHIAQAGFKGYEQKSILLSAQERIDLHEVKLSVGDIGASVEVEAEGARVATDSSARSVLINRAIIEATPIRGRDYLGVLRSLPGVQVTSTSDRPGATGPPLINGGSGQFLVTLDGIGAGRRGPGTTGKWASLDAIGEVQVLTSNYNAEYGVRAVASLTYRSKTARTSTMERLLLLAARTVQRQRMVQQQKQFAETALSIPEPRRHHWWSGLIPGLDSTGAARSCSSSFRASICTRR
jgi:hypothetical protein